ncbi:DegT/DnrJ/EryC1/StrS family aminotransferase [Chryseomicrobium sp. FSL W7-1435]|uniref:DegT/DnrJ/EryC1/StrS family aminotransferase n=1 Tax=Chryseomicrobium sp. FSL W7-1435 TaxID=2921704 RepID=UPI00315B0ACD
MINVTKSTLPPYNEYIEEIKSIWETHWLTNMGDKYYKLQEELKLYMDVPNISLFANGHLALEIALEALDLEGEVITTPFTFVSTTHAIVRNGLTPVFCDINSVDYTIDVNLIESLITEKTSAIMPVHVYGNICDVEEIERIANKYNLKVIYDAAHAFGTKYKGVASGNFGDISMFSFHATKVFNTIEGGGLTFKNNGYADLLKVLQNFGITSQEDANYIAGNAKMNEFQAAMGICNLRRINDEIFKRKLIVERYRNNLDGIKGIKLPIIQEDVASNYSYFPVIFNNYSLSRDEVKVLLEENDIFSRKYFYPLTSELTCYHNKINKGYTPVAQYIADRVLTLPLYADLSLSDVDRICEIIKYRK